MYHYHWPVNLPKCTALPQYNRETRMPHPLQAHFDHVSALLRRLRAELEDDASFQNRRPMFDEYLEANELELALHVACDALLERTHNKPSTVVFVIIEDCHKAMDLQDDCAERLLALSCLSG